MLHDAIRLADDGPVAIRYPKGTARHVGEHEVGSGITARRARDGDGSVCILAIGKLVGTALEGRRGARRDRDRRDGLGRPMLRTARSEDDRGRRRPRRGGHRRGRHPRWRDRHDDRRPDRLPSPRTSPSWCSGCRPGSCRRGNPTTSSPNSASIPQGSRPASARCGESPRHRNRSGLADRSAHRRVGRGRERQDEGRAIVDRRSRAGVVDMWGRAPRPRAGGTPGPSAPGPPPGDADRAGHRLRGVGGSRSRCGSRRARRAVGRADRGRPRHQPPPTDDDRDRRHGACRWR